MTSYSKSNSLVKETANLREVKQLNLKDVTLYNKAGTIDFNSNDVVWVKKYENHCEIRLKNGDMITVEKSHFLMLYQKTNNEINQEK